MMGECSPTLTADSAPLGSDSFAIQGDAAPGWQNLAGVFAENFRDRGEIGASLCVYHRGECVVDLAGGWAQPERTTPFSRDTLAVVFSVTKAMTAIAAHLLIDRGLLDLNAPVSEYWPEFATNGKETATVAMMLNHSVGVPGFHEPLRQGGYLDWSYMTSRLANEKPFWEPGSRNGYHAINFGWTVGELVRRVSGLSLGTFLRREIAEPLEADFWIGLPEHEEGRVADLIPEIPAPGDPVIDVHTNFVANPNSSSAITFTNFGGYGAAVLDESSGKYLVNTRALHQAEIGGAGGIGSARGIARIFNALRGGKLISRDHVVRMSQSSMISTLDPILLMPTHFALGFMKSMDNRRRPLGHLESFIIGETAFGHVGAGGSFALYDRAEELAIGYVINRMHSGILLDERGQALVDEAYKILGYRTNAPGVWVK